MNRFLLTVILLIAIYLYIGICRSCRRHESLWLFVLAGIATIPVNIEISVHACEYFSYLLGDAFIFRVMCFPLAYAILLSMEEIVLGMIGRMIWKNQDSFWGEEKEGE